MRDAELVTFGGSGLDRAAHLRGDTEELARAAADDRARSIVLWRGKPLIQGEERDRLARLAMDHPLVAVSAMPPIFLGIEADGTPAFAHDISGWQPEDLDREAMGRFLDPTEQRHPDGPENAAFCELRARMVALSPRDAELAATAKAMFSWHRSHRFCAKCGQESRMAMAGWQRNCPACGAPHFPRTDPVVIMLITYGNSVLMGRSHGWPDGMWSLLAGFVEPGETIEAAVRREVEEETSVLVGQVDYLASQPWPYPSSLMIGCRGEALRREIKVDPKEIEDARWFTREEIGDAFAGRNPVLKPARKGAIAHFILWNWLADRLD
ncbi:NAD(+) diphosphatase [Marimonas arenosa]|uniref:NAD(+) diphosphatase n=1 Tax=Marimonas arenosa TaxID=1795305 RepID=A0AAE4B317_9RHOB|nr:NAD(+) diphosphatase [Marimonas arenosa]MDQ2089568.1 NAD(+) diphosphatase [Marimonas arenosa]